MRVSVNELRWLSGLALTAAGKASAIQHTLFPGHRGAVTTRSAAFLCAGVATIPTTGVRVIHDWICSPSSSLGGRSSTSTLSHMLVQKHGRTGGSQGSGQDE